MDIKEMIISYMHGDLKNMFLEVSGETFAKATEIRMRAGKPLLMYAGGMEFFLPHEKTSGSKGGYIITQKDIQKTLELMSGYSLYALEEELKQGYMTLMGGHRVGITGRAVVEGSGVKTLKYINALNIRISHEIKGCGEKIKKYVAEPEPLHTMIISPPGCGKTTLLRDIVRILSNAGHNVAVADERSEIAGCYMGVAQNDVGIRTDVLDACPKAEGMMMLLRAMSPEIIAVDEIGKEKDVRAIEEVLSAGVKIFCTVHANSMRDLEKKPALAELVEKNIFERFVVVSNRRGPGTIDAVYGTDRKEALYAA